LNFELDSHLRHSRRSLAPWLPEGGRPSTWQDVSPPARPFWPRAIRESLDFPRISCYVHAGTRVEVEVVGRGASPGCANFRQALASPYPGRTFHDSPRPLVESGGL